MIDNGFKHFKFIKSKSIIIEDRVNLNCRYGCEFYGKKLTCPPYSPTPSEFKQILKSYQNALLIIEEVIEAVLPFFISKNYTRELSKNNESVLEFKKHWFINKSKSFKKLLSLESEVFALNNPFVKIFWYGTCSFCKECAKNITLCRYPNKRRSSMEAVGINVVKTLKNNNITLSFPVDGYPKAVSLLLIN